MFPFFSAPGTTEAPAAGTHPQFSTKCAFLNTGTGGDGPNGDRFLNMEVTLRVQNRAAR
jgi:hypothetical protein